MGKYNEFCWVKQFCMISVTQCKPSLIYFIKQEIVVNVSFLFIFTLFLEHTWNIFFPLNLLLFIKNVLEVVPYAKQTVVVHGRGSCCCYFQHIFLTLHPPLLSV